MHINAYNIYIYTVYVVGSIICIKRFQVDRLQPPCDPPKDKQLYIKDGWMVSCLFLFNQKELNIPVT